LGDNKNEEEILKIYRDTLKNIGKGGVELIAHSRLDTDYFDNMISVEGEENLDNALKLGKGVVAISAHFGNFPFLVMKLGYQGYPFSYIIRESREKGLTHYLNSLGHLSGARSIPDKPPKVCVEQSLRCLRENRILFLQIDLNVISGGIYVDFFGHMVPTFKGPLVLAMRTGAPIIPVFIVRENGNRHKIIIDRPVDLDLTGEKNKDISTNLTKLSKIVESYIRQYPDQWWWIHQRWRNAKTKEVLED